MRVPVNDLSIMVGLDGLALVKHDRAVALEELVTVGLVEVIFRVLEAERRAEKEQFNQLIN